MPFTLYHCILEETVKYTRGLGEFVHLIFFFKPYKPLVDFNFIEVLKYYL